MKKGFGVFIFLFTIIFLVPFCFAATVTVDQNTQYQTILGWGNAGGPSGNGINANNKNLVSNELYNQMLDDFVNNFGFTSTYGWPQFTESWESYNDNDNPYVANWNSFNSLGADQHAQFALDVKQRVTANGDQFLFLVRSGYGIGVVEWLEESPAEYTEQAITYMTYMKNTHGLDVDYWSIENEPGIVQEVTSAEMIANVKNLGPALQANGFSTKIIYPEGANPTTSWNYISPFQNDPDVWKYVGLVTWHRYFPIHFDPYRSYIYNFAKQKGISTGQTETNAASVSELYNDLTLGGVSYWAPGFGYFGVVNPNTGTPYQITPSLTTFVRSPQFYQLRQITHYTRPGAVRVGAASDDSNLLTVAFKKNGKVTLVLINNGTTTIPVTINSLPSGTYGVSQAIDVGPYVELGMRSISGSTNVNLPGKTTLTFYPYAGTNQAPIITDWKPTPDYVTSPASTATLSVSATDPELDSLSYQWTVKNKPGSSNPSFTTPTSSSTTVNGLTVGNYTFTITVSDATHSVSRDLFLNVYTGNQPPYNWELFVIGGGRHLVGKGLGLNIWGRDIENNAITYSTTLTSKPAGSNAVISNPTSTNPRITTVDKPGQYVLRVETRDSSGSTIETISATYVTSGQAIPVVTSATATQAGSGQIQFNASATDADGDALTYWWSLKSGPANAKPVFQTPGLANTFVTNFTSGNYVFTITAIDETNFSKRDVPITITGGSPSCGNGIIETGEQCDTGNLRGLCPAVCSMSCTTNVCNPIPPCVNTTWLPSETTLCGSVTQTSNCGNTRTIQGGVQCTTGQVCVNNACITGNIPPGNNTNNTNNTNNNNTNNTGNNTNTNQTNTGGSGSHGGFPIRTSKTPIIIDSKSLQLASPLTDNIIRNFNPDTGIKQIELRVIAETSDIEIVVSQYEDVPQAVSVQNTGKIYKYLQIETENLENNLDNAIVTFQVEKTWIRGNRLVKEDIALFKFDEENRVWDELSTDFVIEDTQYYYYQTTLESFSYFLIGQRDTGLGGVGAKLILALIALAIIAVWVAFLIITKSRKRAQTAKNVIQSVITPGSHKLKT